MAAFAPRVDEEPARNSGSWWPTSIGGVS
jgi:hypothetical protein